MEGRIRNLPKVDNRLKDAGLAGLLIGGLARQNVGLNLGSDPRKDIDVLIMDDPMALCDVDKDPSILQHEFKRRFDNVFNGLRDLDLWCRFKLPNFDDPAFISFARGVVWHSTMTNLDGVDMAPGLHIPDRAFMERVFKNLCVLRPELVPREQALKRSISFLTRNVRKNVEPFAPLVDTEDVEDLGLYTWSQTESDNIISAVRNHPLLSFLDGEIRSEEWEDRRRFEAVMDASNPFLNHGFGQHLLFT